MNQTPVILYVEDDAKSRTIMNLLLKSRMGLEYVTIFEDSTDFLTHLRSLQPVPNIIFLDIYDNMRALPQFATLPIVAVSAMDAAVAVPEVRRKGLNGFIAKPIDGEVFSMQVAQVLAGESVWDAGGMKSI